MCHYCHVLKNNPGAPVHQGINCLDRSNIYSQVPLTQRIYDRGRLIFPIPSTPPADQEPNHTTSSGTTNIFTRFMEIFTK